MIYAKDIDYARGRLNNTFVPINGELVYVKHIGRNPNPVVTFSDTEEGEDVGRGALKDIDLTPIKLGYSNYNGKTKYIMRTPARRWKQGVDNQSVKTLSTYWNEFFHMGGGDFRYTFSGKYPTLQVAIKRVKQKNYPVAFSRVFALLPENKLEYKGKDVVGTITDLGMPILDRKFMWLEEALRENV